MTMPWTPNTCPNTLALRMPCPSPSSGPIARPKLRQGAACRPKAAGQAPTTTSQEPTVVAMELEKRVEPIFHPDSYGYRPRRSALDAVGTCRRRCWENDWVLDLDIQKFLDAWSYCFLSDCQGWNSACSGAGGSMRSPF